MSCRYGVGFRDACQLEDEDVFRDPLLMFVVYVMNDYSRTGVVLVVYVFLHDFIM
jgi:hypothetical protein